ncbi:MAG: outer membrane beta-barrel protein [Xanthobacteraceae bacterium]|nr:outer membrane beta-barrel protein [Xanthobacteraceae bacterium]
MLTSSRLGPRGRATSQSSSRCRLKLLACLVGASLMLCGGRPADAGSTPAPAAVFNWTGFYAGLNGGTGGGTASPTYSYVAPSDFGPDTTLNQQSHRLGGLFAGAQFGYTYQSTNNVVLGAETDFQWSGIQARNRQADTTTNPLLGAVYLNTSDMTIGQNWFGTTRARLGYAFADRILAYATGGVAYAQFNAGNGGLDQRLSPSPTIYGQTSGAMTSTRVGWVVGAGFEYAIDPRMSIKSEYLYSQFAGVTAPYLVPPDVNGTFSTGSLGVHMVRAGLNYRFGEPSNALALAPATPIAAWRPSWTGFYAGVNGGYGAGTFMPSLTETTTATENLPRPPETSLDAIDMKLRASGFVLGGQLGYTRELANRIVAGIETDLQWSGIDARSRFSESDINGAGTFAYTQETDVRQDWFGTTRLRLGYEVFDRAMIYATGGVAYAHFSAGLSSSESTNSTFATVSGTESGGTGVLRIGWAAGAGMDCAITPGLSLRSEYLYSQYAGFSFPFQSGGVSSFGGVTTTSVAHGNFDTGTLGIHLVRVGLNWKLGPAMP